MKATIYLCHKCYGDLGYGNGLFGCGCISGYVRDWYLPMTIEQAKEKQAPIVRARHIWNRENHYAQTH